MSFYAAMRPRLARPCQLLRVGHVFRVCYHELPRSSTKGTTRTSVASSFPGDSEPSSLASDLPEETKRMHEWNESLATLSEAVVRADQDDVNLNINIRVKKSKTPCTEKKEPGLDKM